MDYSGVFAGLSILAAMAAIVGAGALMALPGFGRWLTEKVANFFTDAEQDDVEDDDGEPSEEQPMTCEGCGVALDSDDQYCYLCADEFQED